MVVLYFKTSLLLKNKIPRPHTQLHLKNSDVFFASNQGVIQALICSKSNPISAPPSIKGCSGASIRQSHSSLHTFACSFIRVLATTVPQAGHRLFAFRELGCASSCNSSCLYLRRRVTVRP